MTRLPELQAKYDAVVAENERLYHDLRAEQAQRERFESAYRRVQKDVRKDQAILRRLYAQLEPDLVKVDGSASSAGKEALDKQVLSKAALRQASGTASPNDGDRIRGLERDCAYLRAKVESFQLALRRCEMEDPAPGASNVLASNSFLSSVPETSHEATREIPAAAYPLNADAVTAERAGRQRAEEQLTRCHTMLRSLRDDAAQKELFYREQLAALQEQNAALLEDLDMWVIGEQQTYLANVFAPKWGKSVGHDEQISVPSGSTATPEDGVDATAHAETSAQIQQMKQYLKDQEEVLALKDKSIAQLEARVQELEAHVAGAAEHATPQESPPIAPVILQELRQLRREAAAAEAVVERYAAVHLPATYILPHSSLRSAHHDAPTGEPTAETTVRDVRSVLRLVEEVLSRSTSTAGASPLRTRNDMSAALRAPPVTVIQPVASSSHYHSGETLLEAAQHLAKLTRRQTQR